MADKDYKVKPLPDLPPKPTPKVQLRDIGRSKSDGKKNSKPQCQ